MRNSSWRKRTLEHHFRHMSIRARLAFGGLLPLALATTALVLSWAAIDEGPAAGKGLALLSGAMLLVAIGSALVLQHINACTLLHPLESARRLTQALVQGHYGERIRVDRLDEAGRLLVALEELGDYLAVMLPEENAHGDTLRHQPWQSVPAGSLERIAERLRQGGEAIAGNTEGSMTRPEAEPARSTATLRLVARQV
jgi:methyl-accepting chemotaxis protein I, serine sensor receptor